MSNLFCLYTNDIVLLAKTIFDLQHLKVPQQFCKSYELPINIHKTKVMIIKYKK